MLLFAARYARLGRRAARESFDGHLPLLPELRRSLLAELSLAAVVIGCVAILLWA